jgi:hypothetical protein
MKCVSSGTCRTSAGAGSLSAVLAGVKSAAKGNPYGRRNRDDMQLPAVHPTMPTRFCPSHFGVNRGMGHFAFVSILLVPDTTIGPQGGTVNRGGAATGGPWLNPRDEIAPQTANLSRQRVNDIVSTPAWSTPSARQNQWTLIRWPLAGFEGVDKSRIKNIELCEWNDGFYCFDYVFFQ